jgi:C_GCAxxG_C_C family probable redox protein
MTQIKTKESIDTLKKEARNKAYSYEIEHHCCSQATMLALQEVLGMEDELTFKATSSVCGGMALSGNTCGALSAGVMVMGMKYGRGDIKEDFTKILKGMLPAAKLVKWFEKEFGTVICRDITGFEMDVDTLEQAMQTPEAMLESLDQEQVEKCSQLCGKTAEKVIEIISEEE